MLAGDIRIDSRGALECGSMSQRVKIPDALIAATAIIYKADELHTFDPILLESASLPILSGLQIVAPPESGKGPLGF